VYSDIFWSIILFPYSGPKVGRSFVGYDFGSLLSFPAEFSYSAQMKNAGHSSKKNQNPKSCIQHQNLFQARPFEVPRIACVLRGWYSDGDRSAKGIINLDTKLERRDVTVLECVFAHRGIDR